MCERCCNKSLQQQAEENHQGLFTHDEENRFFPIDHFCWNGGAGLVQLDGVGDKWFISHCVDGKWEEIETHSSFSAALKRLSEMISE